MGEEMERKGERNEEVKSAIESLNYFQLFSEKICANLSNLWTKI